MPRTETKRKIDNEQMTPPERVQTSPAIRRGGFGNAGRWAFCKTVAGEGNTLQCFLDKDNTGEEVTVYFTLLNCEDLSEGHLSLADGTPIWVAKRADNWWCTTPIEGSGDCS